MQAKKKKIIRCWEFFHCSAEKQKRCLMSEIRDGRCWEVNIACCRMDLQTPRPLSVKRSICKNCEYYKLHFPLA